MTSDRGDFEIVWTTRGATRHVEIIDRKTGKRKIARDWSDWDEAYGQALRRPAPCRDHTRSGP